MSPQTPTPAEGFKAAYYDSGAVATPTLTPTAPITPTLTVRGQGDGWVMVGDNEVRHFLFVTKFYFIFSNKNK